jgi:hypothetical protein
MGPVGRGSKKQKPVAPSPMIAQSGPNFMSDPGLIARLDSPFETHDWVMIRSGFLRRLRVTLGRTRATIYLYLLKQHPVTKAAALECYLVGVSLPVRLAFIISRWGT